MGHSRAFSGQGDILTKLALVPGDDFRGSAVRKPVALVILSGGGFTFETKCLLGALADNFEFVYLKTRHGGVPGEDGIPLGEAYPALSFASKTKPSIKASLWAFFATFITTLRVVRRAKVDIVLAAACSHAVPMLLAGRLLGRRTVCIESITRVDRLSNTGKLVYYLHLASTFLVQWPNLRSAYPHSRLGTIL